MIKWKNWSKFLKRMRIVNMNNDVCCSEKLKARIVELEEKSKIDDDYINDLEQDNYRLIDMVTELSGGVPETKVKLRTNQLELFEDK